MKSTNRVAHDMLNSKENSLMRNEKKYNKNTLSQVKFKKGKSMKAENMICTQLSIANNQVNKTCVLVSLAVTD